MVRIKGDAWVAIGLLAACAVFLRDLLSTDSSGAYVKSTTLPVVLAIALVALSLLLLGWSLLQSVRHPPPPRPPGGGLTPATRSALRVPSLIVLIVLYITALPWFGFLITTAVLIAGASLLYGNRRPLSIIGVMVFLPAGLLLFFEKYMIVLLPSARLFE